MKEIVIPSSQVSKRATYIRHVLCNGHVPGVLSGAELAGKAKHKFGAKYKEARDAAHAIAELFGVYPCKFSEMHNAVVWSDMFGEKVMIILSEDM